MRGLAMGIYGLGVSFAPAVGPTLGGWITEHIDWRWVFYINVPIGILNFVSALFFLPDFKTTRRVSFNFISYFFISVGTVSLLVVLSKGQQMGWFYSEFIGYLTFLSLFSYLMFALSEMLSRDKLLSPEVFRVKEFVVAFLVYFLLLGFSMYQVFYLIPLYFEHLKGLSTFEAGLRILPLALAIGVASPVAGLISDRLSDRLPLYVAVFLYLFSSLYFLPRFDYYTPSWEASLKLVVLGVGLGFFFAPVTNLALKRLGEHTTLGASLMHYIRFIGGSFGTALATNDLQKFTWESFERMTEVQNRVLVSEFLVRLKELLFLGERKVMALFYKYEYLMALSEGFQKTFFVAGLWGILGSLPVVYLLLEGFLRRRG